MQVIQEFSGPFRWLSNFWLLDQPVHDDLGLAWPTVEHAYQASKTELIETRRLLGRQAGINAGTAKRLGRSLALRPDWDAMKSPVMLALLLQKFQQPDLKAKLLATGETRLVEGNRWGDRFWGVDLRTGEGRNELGRLLMLVRDELRAQTAKA
jgi:ribA/ribD-fused uncharacterized protein